MTYLLSTIIILLAIAYYICSIYYSYRKKQIALYEKKYEKTNQEIIELAKKFNLSVEKIPFFTLKGRQYFKKSLPDYVASTSSSAFLTRGTFVGYAQLPIIEFYTEDNETRTKYRFVWILKGKYGKDELSIYFLPMNFTDEGKVRGIIIVYLPTPLTKHRISIRPEPIWNLDHDFEMESIEFNKKFHIWSRENKLLTHVFDPILMQKFNEFKINTFHISLKENGIFGIHKYFYNPKENEDFLNLVLNFKVNYDKAKTSFSESK